MPPFLLGVRNALMLPAWVVAIALVGVGSLARDVGYPVEVAIFSTLLVWAGPAQVVFFGSIAAGAAWPAIALAISFSSLRFLPMTVSILPLLRKPGQGLLMQALLAHFVSLSVWVEGLRRLPHLSQHMRVPYYLGFATTCISLSAAATGAGYYLVDAVPPAVAAGLLFMSPIFFIVSLIAGVRGTPDIIALILGFMLAPLAAVLIPGGFDLIAAGLIGGTTAFIFERRSKARTMEPLP
jgi:predicted branched-subunit amino acid permease